MLALTLFFGSFTLVYGDWSVLGDLFPGFLSWGYTFGLMALALMVWALVSYDDARERPAVVAAGTARRRGHPAPSWNGELLIALVLAAELVMLALRRYRRDQLGLTAATVIITGFPLA